MKNLATYVLNILYGIIILLFFLDGFTGFDIKAQAIKTFVYVGLLVGSPVMLVWNFFVLKAIFKRVIWTLFPTIILTLVLVVGPMKILFSTGTWRTQTILYQNGHLSFKTVEFQMQDIGALGYNRRTVEVIYLTPLFILTSEVPNDIDKRVEWVKVDKDVNELGLKFP